MGRLVSSLVRTTNQALNHIDNTKMPQNSRQWCEFLITKLFSPFHAKSRLYLYKRLLRNYYSVAILLTSAKSCKLPIHQALAALFLPSAFSVALFRLQQCFFGE